MDKYTSDDDFSKFYFTILIFVFTIVVIFFIYRTKKAARRSILFTGLCNSGKTLLYSRLVHGRLVNTFTSVKENSGEYIINGSSLRIIDIPGHERVRDKFFDQYKVEAKAIVYVIDSSLVQNEIRDIAEYLYNILSNPVVADNKFNLLILCNKQDISTSKSSTIVKSLLEKELSTLQLTKSSQLESVDPKSKKSRILVDGDKFDFGLLSSIKVDFIDCNATSVEDESANLKELENWLLKIA